jgi:tetratricopeptide (TPR) repeat protein
VRIFSTDILAATWRQWLPRAVVIVALVFWIFSPAMSGHWLWDDTEAVAGNHIIHGMDGFWQTWVTTDGQGDYYPLTAFVRWIQWQLEGNNTLGYHLTNIFLHVASAFLVWRLFIWMEISLAWVGALFFTVHPIMVESVAWITELKNTLSLPLLLLAMLLWLAWEKGGERRHYFGSLACFIASLLAKTSGLMLPILFLGHAWWKRGKITGTELRAAVPFFAIAFVAAIVTVLPHHGAVLAQGMQTQWSLAAALASAGWSLLFLLGKCLFPIRLLPAYPGLAVPSPTALDLVPWLVLGGLVYCLWLNRAGWGRHLLFGFGFFLINLIPVVGFILIHYAFMVWSMDHLCYLPIIGLIGLSVGGFGYLEARLSPPWRSRGFGVIALLVILMAWESHDYATWFAGPKIFWSNLLRADPGAWRAQLNLGLESMDAKDYAEAIGRFREVIRLQPNLDDGHYNLGVALDKTGNTAQAEEEIRHALAINPAHAKAYLSIGEIMRRNGKSQEAETIFRQGLAAVPNDPSLAADLGGLLFQSGRVPEAIDLYRRAVENDPDMPQLEYNLGVALLQTGKVEEAVNYLETAVRLDPSLAAAHGNLGSALAQLKRLPEAIDQFQAAVQINPGYLTARFNLGLALAQSGRFPEAIDQFNQILRVDPANTRASQILTKLQQMERQQGASGSH